MQPGAISAANDSLLHGDRAYAEILEQQLDIISSSVPIGTFVLSTRPEASVTKASSHPIIESAEEPSAMPEPSTERSYKTVTVEPNYVPQFYAVALVLIAITRWKKLVRNRAQDHESRSTSQREFAQCLAPEVVHVTVPRRKEKRSHTVISTPTRSPEVHDEVENLSSTSMTSGTVGTTEMEYADMANTTITTGMGDDRSSTAENVLGDDKITQNATDA
jgi:hypothetical protein